MTKPKHTPEPWIIESFEKNDEIGLAIVNKRGQVIAWLFSYNKNVFNTLIKSHLPTQTNAQRIIDCVNACEGINPKAISEMLKALKTLIKRFPNTKGLDYMQRMALIQCMNAIAKAEKSII